MSSIIILKSKISSLASLFVAGVFLWRKYELHPVSFGTFTHDSVGASGEILFCTHPTVSFSFEMGCSCVGLVAIVAGAIATVLFTVSFGLPMWSSNGDVKHNVTTTNIKLTSEAKLAVGVWGICTDFKASLNNDDQVDGGNCYLYYTSSEVQTIQRKVDDNGTSAIVVSTDQSLCDLYKRKDGLPVDFETIPKTFFEDTCGSLGKATLAFSSIAASLSVVMFVLLLLGVTCCKKNNIFVRAASGIAVVCFLFSIAAIVLWAVQSDDLNDDEDTNFGISFYLAIVSAAFFVITSSYGFQHAHKGVTEQQHHAAGYHNARTPASTEQGSRPTTGTGTNLV